MTIFEKGHFLQNNFDQMLTIKFGIQEELLLIFLDTKYHWHPVQNGEMTSD